MSKGRKKILHLITGLETGGAEMMLLKTLPSLQEIFDNHVCCIRGHGPIGKKLSDAAIPVHYLELKNIFDLGIILRFKKIIQIEKPDLLVTYLIHADLFGRIFGRLFGIKKIICSVRVKLIQIKYLPLLLLDALTSPLVTRYHFNSQVVADMYHRYFFLPKRKSTVIPNGLDITLYQKEINKNQKKQELSLPQDSIIISCVGRLEKQKGQEYLIKALVPLSQNQPNLHLLLIGAGSNEKMLKELAKNLKIAPQVHFLGKTDDVPQLLAISDIFTLPSLYEGMSNALMEAMATGLPIVATDIPENKEVIENNGLLVPPKDSKVITQALQILLQHPEKRLLFGQNAKQAAYKKFALRSVIDQIKSLYRQVIS